MSDRQDASEFTKAANDALLGELPFEYRQDFEDAERGFIAPLVDGGKVTDKRGRTVFDPTRLDFGKLASCRRSSAADRHFMAITWAPAHR
jgi:alkyl sulfatase BDS1-like metallo-beta-lactamase superfamily hydrolase